MQNLYASSALIQQAIIQASRMQASGGSPVFPQPAPQGSHQGSPALAPALSQAMRLQHSHMAAAAAAAGLPAAPGVGSLLCKPDCRARAGTRAEHDQAFTSGDS